MRILMTVRRVEDAMASWFDAFDAVPEPIALGVNTGFAYFNI
jgi:hypothetical protein